MFGWLKSKIVDKNSYNFDLKPLLSSLSFDERSHANALADTIFSEIHRISYGNSYKMVLDGWIFFDYKIELYYDSLYQMMFSQFNEFSGDKNDKESHNNYIDYQIYTINNWNTKYKSYFPFNSLQSVYKLAKFVMPSYNGYDSFNSVDEETNLKVLNLIALESAVYIVKNIKIDPRNYYKNNDSIDLKENVDLNVSTKSKNQYFNQQIYDREIQEFIQKKQNQNTDKNNSIEIKIIDCNNCNESFDYYKNKFKLKIICPKCSFNVVTNNYFLIENDSMLSSDRIEHIRSNTALNTNSFELSFKIKI